MIARNAEIEAFLKRFGWQDAARFTVAGDASNRRYERLTRDDGSTTILLDAPPETGEDTVSFVHIARYLRDAGLSAPEIYHGNPGDGLLLIEDLGDALFARLLKEDPGKEPSLYLAAVDVLVTLHRAAPAELPLCDANWLTGMTDLFFDWYVPSEVGVSHDDFAKLFSPLAQDLDNDQKVVILRDYHAENLLWLPERLGVSRVGVLDFQDALLGHPAYDLVSVLQDARRDVAPDVEEAMLSYYLERTGLDEARYRRAYAILGAQRNLRILGIFARLCLRDCKPRYVDMIPRVWGHVMQNLAHPDLGPVMELLRPALAPPSPEFLESLKTRCATVRLP